MKKILEKNLLISMRREEKLLRAKYLLVPVVVFHHVRWTWCRELAIPALRASKTMLDFGFETETVLW